MRLFSAYVGATGQNQFHSMILQASMVLDAKVEYKLQ